MKRMCADDGSVLLLGIGLAAVCLLALAVVADSASVFVQRGELQARADAAALSGAQGIDIASYYQRGVTESTALDPATARERAIRALQAQQALEPIADFTIDSVNALPDAITVTVSAPLRLEFFGGVIQARVGAESSARLDLKTR